MSLDRPQDVPQPASREAAAAARVKAALDLIQEAQGLLGQAAAALCPVVGMVPEWRKVGALYDRVHAAWYQVEGKATSLRLSGRLRLDHEPAASEERGAARRGNGEGGDGLEA
jgi:hypothetical protein